MIRVAQIGVGYWGPNLLRNLQSCSDFELFGAADPDPKRREFLEVNYPGLRVAPSADEFIGEESVDALVIATPAALHAELAIAALKAGKHVLVEKPLGTSIPEVKGIQIAAAESGLIAMVGHTFLFNPAVRLLRSLIVSGELGEIRYLYSQRLNLGRIRADVDALWNLAPHDVSIMQYLLGDPTPQSVHLSGMDFIQQGINDVSFMEIRYFEKKIAQVHVSWLDPHKVRKVTVVGSRKMVVYDDLSENKISVFDKGIDSLADNPTRMDYDNSGFPQFSYRSGDVLLPKVPSGEPLQLEVQHFADCIMGNSECVAGPDHALKVVGILSGDLSQL